MKVSKILHLGLVVTFSTTSILTSPSNSITEYSNGVKERFNPSDNMQRVSFDFGNNSSVSDDTLVASDDLIADELYDSSYIDEYGRAPYANLRCGNLYVGKKFCTEGWFVGWIGRHTDVVIEKIIKHKGVYAVFTPYARRDNLMSTDYQHIYTNESDYYDSRQTNISFNFEICGSTEKAIGAQVSIYGIDASNKASLKSGANFVLDSTYTRSTLTKIYSKDTINLTKNSAPFCPKGYSIAQGSVGIWYEIEGKYQTVMQYWWPRQHTELKDWTYFKATYAKNPANFDVQYVYKDGEQRNYYKKYIDQL